MSVEVVNSATTDTQNEYDNAEHFDVQLILDSVASTQLLDEVERQIGSSSPSGRRNLKGLLANLLHASRKGKWLAISRSSNTYSKSCLPRRYNPEQISYRVVDMMDALKAHGLIEMKKGFNDRVTKKARNARIRATPSLISLFDGLPKGACAKESPLAETIVLKGAAKKRKGRKPKLDYADTARVIAMRKRVERINRQIALPRIELPDGSTEVGKLHRVFNNGCWTHGGRFYGGRWQALPKEERKRIRIDGIATVEADYEAMHIKMLYALHADTDYTGDPYLIPGHDLPELRDVLKTVLLTSINAESRTQALASLRERYPERTNLDDMVEAFLEHHEPIRHCFFQPTLGVELQNRDAAIAERVQLKLGRQGITPLPVHDSFIVASPHEAALRTAMAEAYRKHVGKEATISCSTALHELDANDKLPGDTCDQPLHQLNIARPGVAKNGAWSCLGHSLQTCFTAHQRGF